MVDSKLPFVEYEVMVLNGPESKKDILKYMEERFRKFNKANYSWIENDNNPILRLEYPNEIEFIETNTRIYPFFSEILKFIQTNKLSLPEIQFKPIKGHSEENANIYLILKIRTNRAKELRQNYSFSAKIAELIHLATTSEEIEDGFLIFYQDREAFEDAQVNRLDLQELKTWLQKKGIWKDVYQELFSAILESLEFDAQKRKRKQLKQEEAEKYPNKP